MSLDLRMDPLQALEVQLRLLEGLSLLASTCFSVQQEQLRVNLDQKKDLQLDHQP